MTAKNTKNSPANALVYYVRPNAGSGIEPDFFVPLRGMGLFFLQNAIRRIAQFAAEDDYPRTVNSEL